MLRQVVRPYVRATPSLQGAQLYLLAKVIIFHQFSTFLCLLFEGQQTEEIYTDENTSHPSLGSQMKDFGTKTHFFSKKK